tara:strand:+ start:242 stop:403 length:162 start_codon:yes stop_codon:yes gene_type:complete
MTLNLKGKQLLLRVAEKERLTAKYKKQYTKPPSLGGFTNHNKTNLQNNKTKQG